MAAVDWDIPVSLRITRTFAGKSDGDAGEIVRAFGIRRRIVEAFYTDFPLRLSAGQIIAIIGPSGSGKTLLLGAVASAVSDAIRVDPARFAAVDAPVVEAVSTADRARLALPERLAVLSRCGLAEAVLLLAPARTLSGGQLFRLALAQAICRVEGARRLEPTAAERPAPPLRSRLLLIDEFAATLDAATADVLARQMRKLARRYRLGVILVTHRVELLEALNPDAIIVKPLGGPPEIVSRLRFRRGRGRRRRPRFRVTPGTIADYRPLGRFHYLAGPPAAHKRVWKIRTPPGLRHPGGPDVAAVLVVSPPVLNCRGRNAATAGRYVGAGDAGARRAAIAALNAEVECISRVIVHPMFRSCGLAVRLVRHALRHASAPRVEALASMGVIHPFFELAGMRCYGRFAGQSHRYAYYLVRAPAGMTVRGRSGGRRRGRHGRPRRGSPRRSRRG